MISSDYYYQESERLIFRKMEDSDVRSWSQFFVNNEMEHFVGLNSSESTPFEKAQMWIDFQKNRYDSDEMSFGHLAVIEQKSQEMIGVGGILLRNIDVETEFEIAYSILPSHWKKGFATEIAKTLKQFGTEFRVTKQFISIIHIDNIASQNVAIKNGMIATNSMDYHGMPVVVYRG